MNTTITLSRAFLDRLFILQNLYVTAWFIIWRLLKSMSFGFATTAKIDSNFRKDKFYYCHCQFICYCNILCHNIYIYVLLILQMNLKNHGVAIDMYNIGAIESYGFLLHVDC